MKKKNRFSTLLEQLLSKTDIKNYILAQELQYDVSYISKWISGKMIPSEKNIEKTLRTISQCVVDSASEENKSVLFSDYQVDNTVDLFEAIYDHLTAEYSFVKNADNDPGQTSTAETAFYSEMPLHQFLAKTKHPIVRQVKSLEVISAVDILSLDPEYRLMIAELENVNLSARRDYPGVHFSMIINIPENTNNVYDTVFLMNMLANLANIDFQLYENPQVAGKIIFGINNSYIISGMLLDSNHCFAVNTSENAEHCAVICNKLSALCNRNMLLFKRTSIQSMFLQYDYIQSILATNSRWLIGYMTEHFLPDSLFEELLDQTNVLENLNVSKEELRRVHSITTNMLQTSRIKILVPRSAFVNFIVSGELDFFNHKVTLTPDQRYCYLEHLVHLITKNKEFAIKFVINNDFMKDFHHIVNPCLYMSDGLCFLRLYHRSRTDNILSLNKTKIKHMFSNFFDIIWNETSDYLMDNPEDIIQNINQFMQSIKILGKN